MAVWHLSGLQSLTPHILRHGRWRGVKKTTCGDDGERCQHRAVTTQIAGECGCLSVRLFLITRRSTDARNLNLPLAHAGSWVDFDFSSVTKTLESAMKDFIWALISYAGDRNIVACTNATIVYCTLSPKASRSELCPATSGSKDLYLLTWLSSTHSHIHTHTGREKETHSNHLTSHQGRVPHFSQEWTVKKALN